MVKVSVNADSSQVSVSPVVNSTQMVVSSKNTAVAVSMTDSEAVYYSSLAKQSADNASLSSDFAKQYSEIAQTCSKSVQTNWNEDDSNSQAYIQNKPNTVYTAGDGISVQNNVISNTKISATWGNLDGDIGSQTDLKNALNTKTDINFSNISDTAKSVINTVAADKNLSNLSDAGMGKLRIIGEIISLMCNPNYVPEGCLPCDGAEYTFSQFPTFVSNYLTATTPLLQTCTYADYATSISTYGFCDKFGLDTVNQKFKAPTLTNTVYQGLTTNTPVKGNGMTLGLSDGQYNYGITTSSTFGGSVTKGAYGATISNTGGGWDGNNNSRLGVTTDATKSGLVTDNTNLIKSTTSLKYFVVVANGTLNQSQMDWSNYMSALIPKADVDFNNISLAGALANLGMSNANDSVIKIPQKLSDGTVRTYIIQIGNTTNVMGGSGTSIVFPIVYPTITPCIVTMPLGSYTGSAQANSVISALAKSGFTISSGTIGSIQYHYIAIGY